MADQYTSLRDMFDGGGKGKSGDKFEGGGLISALGNTLGGPDLIAQIFGLNMDKGEPPVLSQTRPRQRPVVPDNSFHNRPTPRDAYGAVTPPPANDFHGRPTPRDAYVPTGATLRALANRTGIGPKGIMAGRSNAQTSRANLDMLDRNLGIGWE